MSTVQDIRSLATKLTKGVDDFVVKAEAAIQEKENVLDKKIKQYATLKEKETQLKHVEEALKKERNIIEREKTALSEKQKLLMAKEKKLDQKIAKVNEALNI